MSDLSQIHEAVKQLAEQTSNKLTAQATKLDELSADYTKMQSNLQSLGQELAGGTRAPMGQGESRSLSGLLVKADEFAAFKDARKSGARAQIAIKSDDLMVKSSPILGDGENYGVLSQAQRLGIVGAVERRSWLITGIPRVPVTGGIVEYAVEGFTSAAATQSNGASSEPAFEGEAKGYSSSVYTLQQERVYTIAHFVKVSNQALSDAAGLRAQLDGTLRYRLMVEVERQLVEGDGEIELGGLLTAGNHQALTGAQSDDTPIDLAHRGITQLLEADYQPTVIVMSPTAWQTVALAKDQEGRYLHGAPATGGPRTLWGLPVITTPAMPDDRFVVADMPNAATVGERQDAVIELGYSGDDFTRNLVTIRAELRLALLIQRPTGVVVGTF